MIPQRIQDRLARMRSEIAKSQEAAGRIAQARREAEEIVSRRWLRSRRPTAGANYDYAVQRELDESPIVRGLISSDQLARDRAQMYGLEATADLLEHLAEVVDRLETRADRPSSMSRDVPRQRHAG